MPPKKDKKGAKKEAEKVLSAEEEVKRLEEEQRLLEIKQKKERELREQREREAFEAIYNQEKDRLDLEKASLEDILKKHEAEIKQIETKIKTELSWQKFIECDGLPDVSSEKELNTFLSIWEDEPVYKEDEPSVDPLLKSLPQVEKLCTEVALSILTNGTTPATRLRLKTYLLTLRQLIQTKWDILTSDILQHYDHFPLEPNENFYYATFTDSYVVGMWGNLTKNPRYKTIEYTNVNLVMNLPKPISLANVAIRMLYESGLTASFPFTFQESGQPMSVVGGVLFLDLFEMPEAPKTLDTWVIRQILSPTGKLKRVEYPFKKSVAENPEEDTNKEAVVDVTIWPAQIGFEIFPSCFIHRETAKVMSWDEEEKMWSEDNVGDVEINVEKGQVRFRTNHFRPTALVQYTFAEYPIHNWFILSTGPNRCVFTIQGSVHEIQIEIDGRNCRLISPTTQYIEEYIKNQWSTPALLLIKMSQIGLNFIGPKSLNNMELDMIVKNPATEEACISGLSRMLNRFAFRRSPSNRHIASSKIVIQLQECKPGEALQTEPEAWKTIFFDSNHQLGENSFRVGFLAGTSEITDDVKYDTTNADKVKMYSDVYHLLQSVATPPAEGAVEPEASSPSFVQTVAELFDTTRILCFS